MLFASSNNATNIFGLTRPQLRPIVNSIAQDVPVISFDITVERQVQGYYGYSAEKLIPTFSYTTQSGATGESTVFVKRFHRTGPAEAHFYACLQEYRAPIPRMYGALIDSEGREILFLEYVEPIGDIQACERFADDLDNLRKSLAATAHFNAIQLSAEDVSQLPFKDVGQGLADTCETLEHIWDHACLGELGADLKRLCLSSQNGLSQLQALAEGLIEPVAKMRSGLIHSDIAPENTGWRRCTGELLILDLEWIGIGPRFFDAAHWLGGAPDDLQPHCCQRDELAQYYLDQYVLRGGEETPLDQFMKEVSILWIAQNFTMLWFSLARALDGQVDWTEDREAGRRSAGEWLYQELDALFQIASKQESGSHDSIVQSPD